jgi:hypothetical protein
VPPPFPTVRDAEPRVDRARVAEGSRIPKREVGKNVGLDDLAGETLLDQVMVKHRGRVNSCQWFPLCPVGKELLGRRELER